MRTPTKIAETIVGYLLVLVLIIAACIGIPLGVVGYVFYAIVRFAIDTIQHIDDFISCK